MFSVLLRNGGGAFAVMTIGRSSATRLRFIEDVAAHDGDSCSGGDAGESVGHGGAHEIDVVECEDAVVESEREEIAFVPGR